LEFRPSRKYSAETNALAYFGGEEKRVLWNWRKVEPKKVTTGKEENKNETSLGAATINIMTFGVTTTNIMTIIRQNIS
jgi:hypothetical protein